MSHFEEDICPVCSGSGEGMYEGSRCYNCKGRGSVIVEVLDDDELENDDGDE